MSRWQPDLFPKQLAQFNCTKRYQLLVGPRMCGKTYGLEHSILRHCWTQNARVAIISKTTRSGTAGIWPELTTQIFNEWVEAGVQTEDYQFGWTKAPFTNPTTKINQARMRNRFGGESEIMLYPIERAEDAEEKLYSTQFSAIWLSESHLYDNRSLFDTARMQLRLLGVKYEDYRLFIDENYPRESRAHWTYKIFYEERHLPEEKFDPSWDDDTRKAMLEMQQESAVFEFTLADNTKLDPRQAANVRATYANNKDDYRRLVVGGWGDEDESVYALRSNFDKNIHVMGDASHPNPDEWELLAPYTGVNARRTRGKLEMIGGWDPGSLALWQSANHSWTALAEWEDDQGIVGFDILEEHVVLKEDVGLEEFTLAVMEKRAALADFAGVPLIWTDYSDGSTLRFRSEAQDGNVPKEDQTDAGVITATSKGEIRLIGSDKVKAAGWQQRRVNLISKLLAEKRIRISAHCFNVIGMMENLKKDLSPKAKTFLDMTQPCKHVFDALSYAIGMRMLDQLLDEGVPRTRKRRTSFSSV